VRVVYYTRMLQSPSGGGTHARGLVDGLRQAGHEVCAVPEGSRGLSVAQEPGGIRVPEALKIAGREARARRRLSDSQGMIDSAVEFRPDVAIVRRTTYDLVADRVVHKIRVPIIAEVNAVVAKESHKWGERLSRREIEREREFIRGAARVSCVSAEVAEDVVALGVPYERIVVVENGVDATAFSPQTGPEQEISRWATAHDGVVGYCGSVGALHDVDALIESAEEILADRPGTGFAWIGLSSRQLAERATASLVQASYATGVADHEAVPHLLAVADVFWCAFHFGYGSPLKVYEYAAMGRPIVAAAYGMPARTVKSSGAGFVVPPGDRAGLVTDVRRLLDDEDMARRLGQRGREWVLAGHTWEHVARAMLEGL